MSSSRRRYDVRLRRPLPQLLTGLAVLLAATGTVAAL